MPASLYEVRTDTPDELQWRTKDDSLKSDANDDGSGDLPDRSTFDEGRVMEERTHWSEEETTPKINIGKIKDMLKQTQNDY